MQGGMNATATFIRVMEDLFHAELGKFIWIYMTIFLSSVISFQQQIKHVEPACRKLKEHKFYANPY